MTEGASDLDPLQIYPVAASVYCPRSAYHHLAGAEARPLSSARYALGIARHKKVHRGGERRPRVGRRVENAVPLVSHRYGIVGKADAVEWRGAAGRGGAPVPVEYKPGPSRRLYRHHEVQVALQAICLEEMYDRPVLAGVVSFLEDHRRVEVPIDDALRAEALGAVERVRSGLVEGPRAFPRVDDERCIPCIWSPICHPEGLDPGGLAERPAS